nr:hypothetical protein [Tanacetum cinerariifolium]
MSGCGDHQMVKYTVDTLVGKALTWWNTQVNKQLHHKVDGRVDGLVEEVEGLENKRAEFMVELVIKLVKEVTETRDREATVGMTWEDFKYLMRKEFCPNNEMQKLEIEFWCHATIYAMVAATEATTFHNVVLKFGMLTDKEIWNGSLKKNTKKRRNSRELSRKENVRDDNKRSRIGRKPMTARGACFEYGGTDHYKAACPRLNRALKPKGNCQNHPMAIKGRSMSWKQWQSSTWRIIHDGSRGSSLGPEHYDGDLGFSYEMEIPSGQLVEINKEWTGCLGTRLKSFFMRRKYDACMLVGDCESDMAIGMDWLSRHKAEIIFHEKVVRIPLLHNEILRVLGEKPEEKRSCQVNSENSRTRVSFKESTDAVRQEEGRFI